MSVHFDEDCVSRMVDVVKDMCCGKLAPGKRFKPMK